LDVNDIDLTKFDVVVEALLALLTGAGILNSSTDAEKF
jgi:hypothetical protein